MPKNDIPIEALSPPASVDAWCWDRSITSLQIIRWLADGLRARGWLVEELNGSPIKRAAQLAHPEHIAIVFEDLLYSNPSMQAWVLEQRARREDFIVREREHHEKTRADALRRAGFNPPGGAQ